MLVGASRIKKRKEIWTKEKPQEDRECNRFKVQVGPRRQITSKMRHWDIGTGFWLVSTQQKLGAHM